MSNDKSKIGELVDKLFNSDPDEKVVKLLSEEIKVPEGNITDNFIPDMKKAMKGIEKSEASKLIDTVFNTNPNEKSVKSLIDDLKVPETEKAKQVNLEDVLVIDDHELAQYISSKLSEQGVLIIEEDILRILDLEVEFLKLKGVIAE